MFQTLLDMCSDMGMEKHNENNPFDCGTYFQGDGNTSKGYFWCLSHDSHFTITKCDFYFCKDTELTMPHNSRYISLRLEYAKHLPPGKITAYLEEAGNTVSRLMPAGSRVAYTEVLYDPAFYKRHLGTMFTAQNVNPLEILKHMGGEHNWSGEMMNVLTKINLCKLKGMAAELYYVAGAYALMSALIEMGNGRLPKKNTDYENILHVIRYIDEHYTEEIRQDELVRLASMSATKLKSLYRQFTGSTITEYILDKKADHASHLLADSDLTIEEISRQVGFNTVAGFSTSFKKRMGLSPSEYRKRIEFNCFINPSVDSFR
ncbi:helix-turn-helix domain-containing protein [Lachnoclostridium sp. Marseille-P6806]|uniref:helix-turn-helix domain-containing protein n=1 Tax=Lachnoclostridium sp. Marseille-P6806 TaxID=2364793 RepID=UPI0010321A5B|nr:AraC family transcriptional regulator [Lachnoclostridium sp. Marseille-P6806]